MSRRQVILFNPSRRPHGKVLAPGPEFAQRLDPSDSVHIHPWHPELDSFFQWVSFDPRPIGRPIEKTQTKTEQIPPRPPPFCARQHTRTTACHYMGLITQKVCG